MSSVKQFLLSLLATSVSIALTFGTAAIIDNNAKQKSKREIVMMVMYDMYTSLNSIEKTDSMIRQSMELQRKIAEDTTQFDKLRFGMAFILAGNGYTETTERIFSSNIETINTVDNVLFTENVAKFYQSRQMYRTAVCDSLYNEVSRDKPFTTIKGTLDYEYMIFALMSNDILKDMRHLYALCKQMMEVTDDEIDAYQKEREQIEKSMCDDSGVRDSVYDEIIQLQKNIDESKAKLKME
jgi:hypothetical protein